MFFFPFFFQIGGNLLRQRLDKYIYKLHVIKTHFFIIKLNKVIGRGWQTRVYENNQKDQYELGQRSKSPFCMTCEVLGTRSTIPTYESNYFI